MASWLSRLFGDNKKPSAGNGRELLVAGSWLGQDAYRADGDAPQGKAAVELPVYGAAPPTLVRAVQGALLQLEQGQFYAAAYLWDGMLRDDRITATLNVRIQGLLGADRGYEPAEDTKRARRIAEDVEKSFAKMVPNHQLAHLQRYALGLSVGIGQRLAGTMLPKSDLPTLKVWNNRFLRFDWTDRKYHLMTENRGEITLEPGDPEWLIYEPFGPQGWLHGALIRSLAQPWLIRYWTRTWWARYQEVHGQPIRAGIVPENRKPADEQLFLGQLSRLAHEAVIRLPQGADGNKFDMKLIEAESNNWRGFLELLKHCDESIAIVLLGQSQSTEGQGGLGSQEKAGESTLVRLLKGDCQLFETVREQFLVSYVDNEYGDGDLAPNIRAQVSPPEDEGARAKTDLAVAQTLVQFKASGAPLDMRKYLESRGYGEQLLTEQEHAAQKAAAIADAQAAMAARQPTDPSDEDGQGTDEGDDEQAE
jgi:phage gp29-like protein